MMRRTNREDINKVAFIVAAVEKIYAHESLTFNNTVACEVIFKWKAGLKDDMDAQSYVYVLSNGCRKSSDDSDGYYWGYIPAKIWYRLYWRDTPYCSLEGSLSGDYDVEKNDVGMLDKFDRGLQTDVQHIEALPITKAGYMTFTKAWKKKMWLKGLLTKSRYELRLVAGIATGALVKGGSRSEVPTQVEVAAYRVRSNRSSGIDFYMTGLVFSVSSAAAADLWAKNDKNENLQQRWRLTVGAMLIFSVSFQFYQMSPKGQEGHANILCIVPILSDVPEGTRVAEIWAFGCIVFEMLIDKQIWLAYKDLGKNEVLRCVGYENEIELVISSSSVLNKGKIILMGCLCKKTNAITSYLWFSIDDDDADDEASDDEGNDMSYGYLLVEIDRAMFYVPG
nr:zinc finger, CCHC-type [Tanacetum cinerariifolium]